MNLKKLLLLFLALCLVVCLAACGGNTVDQGEKPEKPDGGYEGDGGDDGYEHTTHNWRSWELRIAPTYEATGTLVRDCEGCSENETLTLPKLNANDYKIINAWYPDEGVSCANESIYAQFVYTIDDAQNGAGFEIVVAATSYSPEHPEITSPEYTVWTTENHYPLCSVCGRANTKISEAHTMENGECTVCHYTPDSFIYDEDTAYSTGVSYNANEETVVIPPIYGGSNPEKAGFLVTSIDSFKDNTNLKSLTIPATVDFISSEAFSGCEALENVYYEGTWEDWCDIYFVDNRSNPMYFASSFYMRNENGEWAKVTKIEIPNTVTEISSCTFIGFVGIEELFIPTSVKTIGNAFCDGFSSCHYQHVIIGDDGWPNGYTCDFGKVCYGGSIEDWCRINFAKYARVLEKTKELYFLEDGDYVAHTSITELEIPADVTRINDMMFCGFTGLERIKALGALTEIGDYAFLGCEALKTVDIGAGCKYIQGYAFSECPALVTVTLPKNLEWISSGNFYESDLLRNVYFNGTIADWCKIDFGGYMDNGKAVTSSPLRNGTSDFYILNESGEYVEPFQINNYVTVNNGSPLSLSKRFLVIPEEVTYIGGFQFYGLQAMNDEEYVVIIEGDVTEIGAAAFAGSNIGAVFMPKSVTTIHSNAFDGSFDAYSKIYYEGTAAEWANVLISADITDVEIWYYAATASEAGATSWFWGADGFVYEWVSNGTELVATVNKVLSLKNWETIT